MKKILFLNLIILVLLSCNKKKEPLFLNTKDYTSFIEHYKYYPSCSGIADESIEIISISPEKANFRFQPSTNLDLSDIEIASVLNSRYVQDNVIGILKKGTYKVKPLGVCLNSNVAEWWYIQIDKRHVALKEEYETEIKNKNIRGWINNNVIDYSNYNNEDENDIDKKNKERERINQTFKEIIARNGFEYKDHKDSAYYWSDKNSVYGQLKQSYINDSISTNDLKKVLESLIYKYDLTIDNNRLPDLTYTLRSQFYEGLYDDIISGNIDYNNNFYLHLLKTPFNDYIRSPMHIRKAYKMSRNFIFENISMEAYAKKGAYFVDGLIESYEHIVQTPSYELKLQELYTYLSEEGSLYEITNLDELDWQDKYNFDLLEIYNEIEIDYEIENNFIETDRSFYKIWINSFWIRRFHEQNMSTVYNILLDLRRHYNVRIVQDTDGLTYLKSSIDSDYNLAEIKNGEKVCVLKKIGDWREVSYMNTIGFIHKDKLKILNNIHINELDESMYWKKAIINDSDGYTNIRNDKNEVIFKILSGEEFLVDIEQIKDKEWLRINHKDQKGWIHQSRVTILPNNDFTIQ